MNFLEVSQSGNEGLFMFQPNSINALTIVCAIIIYQLITLIVKFFFNKVSETELYITKKEHEKEVNELKDLVGKIEKNHREETSEIKIELGIVKGIILVIASKVGVENNDLKDLVKGG